MTKKYLLLAIGALLFCGSAAAQWSIGRRIGWSTTTISRYNGGRFDEAYSAVSGFEAGLQGSYAINQWLAVRANLCYMQRSHRMDRNLNYIDSVYTRYRNSYLMLPIVADLSFGGERLRGHLLAGGYADYWLRERRKGTTFWMTDYNVYFEPFDEEHKFTDEDQRLNAGVCFGVGASYALGDKWVAALDAMYYYDLTSHHKSSPHLADPRYLNTLTVSINMNYKF